MRRNHSGTPASSDKVTEAGASIPVSELVDSTPPVAKDRNTGWSRQRNQTCPLLPARAESTGSWRRVESNQVWQQNLTGSPSRAQSSHAPCPVALAAYFRIRLDIPHGSLNGFV